MRLWTTTLVIVETVNALELGLGVARTTIKNVMLAVLSGEGLELEEKHVLVQAVCWFAENDAIFSDCYHRVLATSSLATKG